MGDKGRPKPDQIEVEDDSEFIRSVNDFEKLARVGEGTYGVVCMFFLSFILIQFYFNLLEIYFF